VGISCLTKKTEKACMLSVRRVVITAALACLSALPIVTPPASAEVPTHSAPAAVRAADPVPVDTPVYLIENKLNRGVNVKVFLNWDYTLLGTATGDRVIFHRQGDGYTIQQTVSHWSNYDYWQRGANGVFLGTREDVSVFNVVPTKRGLALQGPGGCYVSYATVADYHWLQCYPEGDAFHAWAYFRTEE
jgi:hypothetical protein